MSIANVPRQTCRVCGDQEEVRPDGRGFPPDIAKRKLAKRCAARGHHCQAEYRAGVTVTINSGCPLGPACPYPSLCCMACRRHHDGIHLGCILR